MRDNEFYKKASLNNTFDLQAAEKALLDIQISSFKYLYEIQLKSTGVKRFDFNMGDLVRSDRIDHDVRYYPRSWVYIIQDNFIAHNKRLEFRNSKFYSKTISFQEIISQPDIFTSSFLLFIDGKLYNNLIHIFCKEDKTVLIFNLNEKPAKSGINKELLESMMKNNVRATFFMLPNHAGGSYDFNQYTFARYDKQVPLSLFGIEDNFKYEDKFMCTVTNKADNETKVCTIDNSLDTVYFLDDTVEKSNFSTFTIDVFSLRHVFQTVQLSRSEEWFTLEIQECPIATQNCLIMTDNNELLHDVHVELFYPNIYHVVGDRPANTPLKILVFYYDDTANKLLEYHNHLAVYYKYVSNVLDKYKNGTILQIIKDYVPVECKYTINNFKETVWFDDHYKFKSEYLRELIHADGNNFIAYLKRQCKKPNAFYLDMKNIDLASRIRTDNSDVDEPTWIEEFDTPRYMFIFKNEFRTTFNNILFSIDGINYTPDKHYYTTKYEYIYIPVDLIKEDSIIEVEKIKTFLREEIATFTSINDEKIYKISMYDDKVEVYHNDIFVTNQETKEYLEKEDYTVSALLDGEWIDINDDRYYPIKTEYKVRINNEALIGVPLKINIKKNFARQIHKIETFEQTFTLLTFEFDMNKDPRHIRLYKNGRVVPRNDYEVIFNANAINEMAYIEFAREKKQDDEFIIECVPYKMKEVYYQRFVDVNSLIDLYGSIDKPLNLKWYDFYLNGRKLTKQNIEIISPCKFILRNVNSDRNLTIVQNDRDDEEWYGFYTPTDIIDKILELEDFIGKGDNEITEDDAIGDPVDSEEDLLYDFWIKFLSRFGFINPDWSQIPEKIVKWYDPLFIKPNNVFMINADRGAETATIFRIMNPDVPKN